MKYRFVLHQLLLLMAILGGLPFEVSAQTIAEKKAGISQGNQDLTPEMQKSLHDINRELRLAQGKLNTLYAQVNELYVMDSPPESYEHLLDKINETRDRLIEIENRWRTMAVEGGQFEAYALWHQPETTLGQLVMDYGSQDYVYMIPAEISNMKMSIVSNLPIPRASWEEMLETILLQNGVGFKQLNPFLRQLFMLKDNKSGLKLITTERRDLEMLAPDSRICFVLTPEPAEVRRTWLFLDKFVNPNSTLLQQVGRDILIIGQVSEIQDLLRLYDFIAVNKGDKEYKIFPMRRVDPDEMAKILGAIFDQAQVAADMPKHSPSEIKDKAPRFRPLPPPPGMGPRPMSGVEAIEANGLKVIALTNVAKALFLVGTKEELRKAEQIITQVEGQVGEAREKIIYWYSAKHSDAEELAEVLYRIYGLMLMNNIRIGPFGPYGFPGGPFGQPGGALMGPPGTPFGPIGPGGLTPAQIDVIPSSRDVAQDILDQTRQLMPSELYQKDYYQQGAYAVNPMPIEPRKSRTPVVNQNRENFIVDPKTSSIAMVVEVDILPKLKELIKKLDVPKRMVQLEVLLFERRLTKQNNFGLNLLRIGDCANNKNFSCLDFNENATGILDYILSRKETCLLPAYDLIYRFLMTQDDIQINASPSVVAINQTPASIDIVDEISIDMGIYNVETAKGNTLERAFTRAQYGTWIEITPTIHITDEEGRGEDEEPNYVTLETDVTFDTFQTGVANDRPDVTRRHISNEVRVPDGQTVILGGLRRRQTDDFKDSIPFLGELPAIGKLFSFRELADSETEMFIFITPTIISDPLDDFERIKCEEMRRRPGDVPEFMCCLIQAREMEKNQVLLNSMDILLGLVPDRCHSPAYLRPSYCGNASWIEDFNGLPPCGEPSCGEYNGQ